MKTLLVISLVLLILIISGCEDLKEGFKNAKLKRAEEKISETPESIEKEQIKEIEKEIKRFEETSSSSYFDVKIISLKEGNLEYELTFNKDIDIWDFWVTFVSNEGNEYEEELKSRAGTEGFRTRGVKKRTSSKFSSDIDNIKGIFYFYISRIKGSTITNFGEEKEVVTIKYNPDVEE